MKAIFAAVAFTAISAGAAFAADKAACLDQFTKLDTNSQGYITGDAAKSQMEALRASGASTANADRMTSAEYMAACEKNLFEPKK
jgi:hypothetical protein